MLSSLNRYVSNLFNRKHVRIYISPHHPRHNNSFFFWIPDDVWMLIVNEWMCHVRELLALEIAIGRRNFEHWIYTMYHRLDILCSVKVTHIDSFLSWKDLRNVEAFRNITMECKDFEHFPWDKFRGITTLTLYDTNTVFERRIFLQELLQSLPEIQELSVPLTFLNSKAGNVNRQSSLKSLKINNDAWINERSWKPVLDCLQHITPKLESLHIEYGRGSTLPEVLTIIPNLRSLKHLYFKSKQMRRRHETYDFGDFHALGDEEDAEIHHNNNNLLSQPTVEFIPWETVTIDTYESFRSHGHEYSTLLFSTLSKAGNLRELELNGDLEMPSNFFATKNPWKFLTVIDLSHVVIRHDQVYCLVQWCAHQLTVFRIARIRTSRDNNAVVSDSMVLHPWIELLLETALMLKTFKIKNISCLRHEDIFQQLVLSPSNVSTAIPCLQTLREYHFALNRPISATSHIPVVPKLISPFHNLEVISLQITETNWHTDVVEILFTHTNNQVLRQLKFSYGGEFIQKPLILKQAKYEKQIALLQNQKCFPRLETLFWKRVYITDEVIKYILCHAPLLQNMHMIFLLLAKKSILTPTTNGILCPNSTNMVLGNGLNNGMESTIYQRKDIYYDYRTKLSLDSPAAIQSLISPLHIQNLVPYLLKGGIFLRRRRRSVSQPAIEPMFLVHRNSAIMEYLTRNIPNREQQSDRRQPLEHIEEERIIELKGNVIEVFVEYVHVNEENERLAIENQIAVRENLRQEFEERQRRRQAETFRGRTRSERRVLNELVSFNEEEDDDDDDDSSG